MVGNPGKAVGSFQGLTDMSHTPSSVNISNKGKLASLSIQETGGQSTGWLEGGDSTDGDEDDGFSPPPSALSFCSFYPMPYCSRCLALLVSSVLPFGHLKDRTVARMPRGTGQAENRNVVAEPVGGEPAVAGRHLRVPWWWLGIWVRKAQRTGHLACPHGNEGGIEAQHQGDC